MQNIIGIDIGTYSLKAINIKSTHHSFEIEDFIEIIYPAKKISDEDERQKIINSLAKLSESLPQRVDTIVASIPGHMSSAKIVTLPFTQRKKIDKTIGFELENSMPFDLGEIIFDYQILETRENESDAFAVIVKRTYLEEFVLTLKSGNIDPRIISVDSVAISNLANIKLKEKSVCYLMVDIGHSKTNLCFIYQNRVRSVRTLLLGGNEITKRLMAEFKLTYEDAINLKHNSGFINVDNSTLDSTSAKLSDIVRGVVDQLIDEINQTIKSFESQKAIRVEEIYLCGGSCKLRNLSEYFSENLEIKCAPLPYLTDEMIKSPSIRGRTSSISLALGLAMAPINSLRTASLNFRKEEFSFRADISGLREEITKYATMGIIILIMAFIASLSSYRVERGKEEKLATLIIQTYRDTVGHSKEKVESPKVAFDMLKSKTSELKNRIDALKIPDMSALDILKEVSNNISRDVKVDIKEFLVDENRVRMKAVTDSIESSDKIVESLSKCPQFKDIKKGQITTGIGVEERIFDIDFTIKGKEE